MVIQEAAEMYLETILSLKKKTGVEGQLTLQEKWAIQSRQ